MPKRRFRRRGRRTPRYRYRGRVVRFRKAVKRTVFRMAELKNASRTLDGTVADHVVWYRLTPSISQGAGDNQRIGNKIFSRYYTCKFFLLINPITATTHWKTVRIYIVWPRRASANDAEALITAANFPVSQLPDQDNWIYWRDNQFVLTDGTINGAGVYFRKYFSFYKRFGCTLEYASGVEVQPMKRPYLIVSHNYDPTNVLVQLGGYVKMTYKDI